MYLVSIFESGKPLGFQTVNSLNDLYRGLCSGLDVSKFNAMSNFNLLISQTDLFEDISTFGEMLEAGSSRDFSLWNVTIENLSDSIYDYMRDNLNVYYDIVKQIDEFKEKITNYKLDK
jgi:hypothetical protein